MNAEPAKAKAPKNNNREDAPSQPQGGRAVLDISRVRTTRVDICMSATGCTCDMVTTKGSRDEAAIGKTLLCCAS